MKLISPKAFGFVVLFFISHVSFSQTAPDLVSTPSASGAILYTYVLSDLNTTIEADSVTTYFKSKAGILNAEIDFTNHKLSVYVENTVQQNDVEEIIRFLGKTILYSSDEITKYYPN